MAAGTRAMNSGDSNIEVIRVHMLTLFVMFIRSGKESSHFHETSGPREERHCILNGKGEVPGNAENFGYSKVLEPRQNVFDYGGRRFCVGADSCSIPLVGTAASLLGRIYAT